MGIHTTTYSVMQYTLFRQQLQQSKFSKQMDELDQKQKKLKKLLRQD